MITHPSFSGEEWTVRQDGVGLDVLEQAESVFALSNGHLGLRGNLDEGEPGGLPGTYLSGFHELRPLPYAEAGYGLPEEGETVVNVTDGKLLRLVVDDEPLDLRFGTVERHVRTLDMRRGVLIRELVWRSPTGRSVSLESTRLVSFAHRAIAAIELRVTCLDGPARIVVQSELLANQPLPAQSPDPRTAAALAQPLEPVSHGVLEVKAMLAHRTRRSGLLVVAAMDHDIVAPEHVETQLHAQADLARLTVSTELDAGQQLRLTKYLAYRWSSRNELDALTAQAEAALGSARHTGWEGLLAGQQQFLDRYWNGAVVEIDGDPELERAVRFAQFQLLQASARAERHAIPAKGLTGPGYDGHTFWDTEAFVVPVLTYTAPAAAADALRWRQSTLALAKQHAQRLGLAGAAFAWRTISGQETSGYWPAGTAAFHLSADVAAAAESYEAITGDAAFARDTGVELAVETARMFLVLGHLNEDGFTINGVTGPDEYSAVADNNVYTNLMVQRNLRLAARLTGEHPAQAARLDVDESERAAWETAADAMVIPYDEARGLHPQSERFFQQERLDFGKLTEADYPLLLSFPYFRLYSTQVVKQADLVLALWRCDDAFTRDQRRRNFAYYEAITVRDSSLSSSVQAVVAAEVGHLDLAYDHLAESAFIDLEDRQHNTRDGLHLAALAGSWLGIVAGFAGLRERRGVLHFAPRLPDELDRIAFRLRVRGRVLQVTVRSEHVTYALLEGDPLDIHHVDERVALSVGSEQTRPVAEAVPTEPVGHPAGRRPRRRSQRGREQTRFVLR